MRVNTLLCLLCAGFGFVHATARPDFARLGPPAKYPATYFRDTTVASPVVRHPDEAGKVSRTWVSSPQQQFLAQILPGARFFRVSVGSPSRYEYWVTFGDSQAFPMDKLRPILAHEGISFDSSSVDAAAKLAVLFAYCGHRPAAKPESARNSNRADTLERGVLDSLAFPSVDFRSFDPRYLHHMQDEPENDPVVVDCVIDGHERRPIVVMHGYWDGDLQPILVYSPDVEMWFEMLPLHAH
ncbi:MAG TPA: hypothetical protein VMH22_01420 [bacterium]|nr:hypothetical protein [bacterium]